MPVAAAAQKFEAAIFRGAMIVLKWQAEVAKEPLRESGYSDVTGEYFRVPT